MSSSVPQGFPALLLVAAASTSVALLLFSRRARKAAFRAAYHLYANTRLGLFAHRAFAMSAPAASEGQPLKGHSSVLFTPFSGFSVLPVAVLGDNYSYLLVDHKTKSAALVDPADPAVCLRAAELAGVRLTHVLTTHKHWDHAGGNDAVKAAVPGVEVVGGRGDAVQAVTREVGDGDTVEVGATVVKVIETPGHTRGHVVYVAHPSPDGAAGDLGDAVLEATNAARWPASGVHSAARAVDPVAERSCAAFTGDLLFSAGCGRFFEGCGQDFYEALVHRLGAFSDATMFFCGHEYTVENLRFARWADPGNEAVARKVAWADERRAAGACTVPFSLAEERLVNPFMRVDELAATLEGGRHAAGPAPGVAVMDRLRELKNDGAHKQ